MSEAYYDPRRVAKTHKSSYYVEKYAGHEKLSEEQKTALLNEMWDADPDPNKRLAFRKLGEGMIGPVQIKLRYEGIGRNILIEDTLERGYPRPYEVLDDLGQAYILNQTDAEVKTTPFEGKWAPPQLFRVASFPFVRKEDLFYLQADIVEYAQDMTREAILKQEDGRLLTLLASAIVDYGANPDHVITPDHVVEVGAGNPIDYIDFLDAASRVELHELRVNRVIINPVDLRDVYSWDINLTGPDFRNEITRGQAVTQFGGFTFQESIMVPLGTVFLVPEPQFLGVMPIMYSLDVEENNQIEQFRRGWVMDELIGMLVLNPRGLAALKKV
jgi:hypothetical protein